MDHISSIAAFFKSGQLSDLLKQPDQAEEEKEKRQNGRPLLLRRRNTPNNVDIDSENNMNEESVTDVLGYLHDMLQVPKNMDGDIVQGDAKRTRSGTASHTRDFYVLWEVWKNREDGLSYDANYSENEKHIITHGPNKKETLSVVRYIRKITEKRDATGAQKFDVPTTFYHKEIEAVISNMPYFDIVKDDLNTEFKLDDRVDCTNIGISCGKIFCFPNWMEKRNVENFITTYNAAALIVLKNKEKKARALQIQEYKEMKSKWIKSWLQCISKKKEQATEEMKLQQWNNTFDLSLLYDHNFTSMSMFTWWKNTKISQLPTDIDYNESQEKESILPQTDTENEAVQNDHFLLPYNLKATSGMVYTKTSMFSYIFREGNDKTAKLGVDSVEPEMVTESEIKMEKHVTNIYALLKKCNGVQGIEFNNLASVLGSEVHTEIAHYSVTNEHRSDDIITSSKDIIKTSAITDFKTLSEYAKALPEIVKKIAFQFLELKEKDETRQTLVKKEDHNLIDYIKCVEFPVYLFANDELLEKPFYSRIDSISFDYRDKEGLAVWEYKTRWGSKSIDKADPDAIRQAAFYCYCLFKMTGIRCKYFYIRYVKVKDEKMLFKTFKFKYQNGYDDTRDLFDFEEKLTNLIKKKKK